MRVFRQRFGPEGHARPSRVWYVEIKNPKGVRVRVRANTDRDASAELGRRLEKLAQLKGSGLEPPLDLARWVADLPPKTLARIARLGIVAPSRVAAGRPITEHVREFIQSLRASNCAPRYVQNVATQLDDVCEGCGWRTLADVDRSSLERYLHDLRTVGRLTEDGEHEKPISVKTSNHHFASVKAFLNWAVERGIGFSNPLARVKGLNADVDQRRIRRALTFEEIRALVGAAHSGPDHKGVSGATRAMAWRLCAECGLRVGELAALKVGDLDLDPSGPTLTVPAKVSKNKTEARLPLRPELARDLAPYAAGKHPSASLLDLPTHFKDKATRWLRFDLARTRVVDEDGEAREIAYRDASERVADVHALRSSFVTQLVRSGANARAVQVLARHSDPRLTLNTYARLGQHDERAALAMLPSLVDGPAASSMRATGTDGPSASSYTGKNSPRNSPPEQSLPAGTCEDVRGSSRSRDAESASSRFGVVTAVGIEPTT